MDFVDILFRPAVIFIRRHVPREIKEYRNIERNARMDFIIIFFFYIER